VSARKLPVLKIARDFGILPPVIFVKSDGFRRALGRVSRKSSGRGHTAPLAALS